MTDIIAKCPFFLVCLPMLQMLERENDYDFQALLAGFGDLGSDNQVHLCKIWKAEVEPPVSCLLFFAGRHDHEPWGLCSVFQNPLTSFLDAKMLGREQQFFFSIAMWQ